ncbi:FAD-binding oxidoreductase [Tianweitania sp. BSSL-BM11]|uniref:FAD-binding oxidoreductase n=1 Tax=Tianweitania aestuarii TaxID=2814886 RepID=A0ABS5S2H5_9HYPH|nr:FAD-binding oxidoreductase [Tianweitania aestuarii]MBS9722127.1 FAD-binding oxidoreductase [Tianweitania aestuarii]
MIAATHHTALADLIGPDNILTEAGDLAGYEAGARYDRGRAALVVRPRDTEQVSKAVAYCVRNGIAIIPQSGNTGVVSGSTPDASGEQVVISLDRLARQFELDIENRSLRVDAGFRLSEVNTRLADHGLQFPIDLGADPRLGGMLSTNTGGSRFLKFGDVRRNVLGIKVVLADEHGTVLDLMSGLRKNNTGVDWKHIFIGTVGAFGIITECELNLEPLPLQVATALLVPRDGAAVMPLLAAMERRLGSYLSAFEGMSGNAIKAALGHVPSLRNPFANGAVPDYTILTEVSRDWEWREGEETLDQVLENVLAEVWESADAPLADAFVGPAAEIWTLRHALSEGVRASGRLAAFDLSFRRQDVIRFCDHMKQVLPARYPGITVCDFGHVGDGGVHFNLVLAPDAPTGPEIETELRAFVYGAAVEEFGGSYSAEHGIGRKNQSFYDHYTDETRRELANGLKALTSPAKLGTVRFGSA